MTDQEKKELLAALKQMDRVAKDLAYHNKFKDAWGRLYAAAQPALRDQPDPQGRLFG